MGRTLNGYLNLEWKDVNKNWDTIAISLLIWEEKKNDRFIICVGQLWHEYAERGNYFKKMNSKEKCRRDL